MKRIKTKVNIPTPAPVSVQSAGTRKNNGDKKSTSRSSVNVANPNDKKTLPKKLAPLATAVSRMALHTDDTLAPIDPSLTIPSIVSFINYPSDAQIDTIQLQPGVTITENGQVKSGPAMAYKVLLPGRDLQ
jgi:hypothetical protein